MGNNSRFINHSCDPNCELQLWLVKGRMHIGIVSLRDIEPDEPLSYDYQFDTNESNVFKCYCGTAKCRGTMAPRRKYSPSDVKTLPFAQRSKLLLEAKNKLLKSEEQQTLEEMQLFNCTGKFVFANSRESGHLNNYVVQARIFPVKRPWRFGQDHRRILTQSGIIIFSCPETAGMMTVFSPICLYPCKVVM
jgi:hypothetical protein